MYKVESRLFTKQHRQQGKRKAYSGFFFGLLAATGVGSTNCVTRFVGSAGL